MKKRNTFKAAVWLLMICAALIFAGSASAWGWVVVDTGQDNCYNNSRQITCPSPGAAFYGQDSQYDGTRPSYTDNGDGTITDNNTGLMWQKDPGSGKMTWGQAMASASSFNLAGYTDWRMPTIKELYSLIDFNGSTGMTEATSVPYINTDYFVFRYGDTSTGERMIDAQYATSTEYVSTTMNGSHTMFGVNFADGRIKGYGTVNNKTFYVMYVRGNTGYGVNNFVDNGDGTVTDNATGLMWMQKDSGHLNAGDNNDGGLNWQQALEWAEDLEYAGHSDWRLPNAKELQAMVDYTRSPDTTQSPAIDPVFSTSSIIDGYGQVNYPYYWTGTTHQDVSGQAAVYVAFGEAQGYMQGFGKSGYTLMDVHGAGAQRSDPKSGDPDDYPYGRGPQGDVIYIYNFVRCVRTATVETNNTGMIELVLNRQRFNFRSVNGGKTTPSQTLVISGIGDGTFDWNVTGDTPWLNLSQSSGTGAGTVTVSVDASGLAVGSYRGTITITSTGATNSPQTAAVYLDVLRSGNKPFGTFDTPAHGSSVSGSIPVTGWVLDDIAVQQVTLYRQENGNLYYIGDAVFVEGARPDVEQAYPDHPLSYKAGWGYMMLTNGLPNGGNGQYTLVATAQDAEGNTVTLGSKTITCDNANAVKPFGAIDSPLQGGSASGSAFRNRGWVLTPNPNTIPKDGSTIDVYVDGVNLGHPVYNVYREDIAKFFPGFANSDGAGGYFDFDTTAFQNGLHTIYWSVTDDAGNSEGIGSRYFSIQNTGASRSSSQSISMASVTSLKQPAAVGSVKIRKGFNRNTGTRALPIDASGRIEVEIEELGRIEMHLPGNGKYDGYMVVNEQLRPLPIGSTMDRSNGVFYWQPGPGAKGTFDFIFIKTNDSGAITERIMTTVKIHSS